MSQFLTAIGAIMLVFCLIWALLWLEVRRDPKNELTDFYKQHPLSKSVVLLAKRIWAPMLVSGLCFLIAGAITG